MKQQSCWKFLLVLCLAWVNVLFGVPAITNLTPYVGPSSGGTVVTITGSGFTGVTAVNFGNKPAASFVFNSDTSITATAPPHTPEVVFVTVTTGSGTSALVPEAYFVFQGDWLVYVANRTDGTISIIDTATHTVVATTSVGTNPQSVAVTPDGSEAYVGNSGSHDVSIIDAATLAVVATPTVGSLPFAIAITPNGSEAYVSNAGTTTVSVINTASHTVVATPTVGFIPLSLAATPNGTEVYVTNNNDDTVSVINTAFHTVVATINVGSAPLAIAITPNGNEAYVVNNSSNPGTVSIIDTASHAVVATPSVGLFPLAIAIRSDGFEAYVVNAVSDSVSVINIASHTVMATVAVGDSPEAVAIMPSGVQAYVANTTDTPGTVSIINTTSQTVVATPIVGTNPQAFAITPDGKEVYVINAAGDVPGNVSVIDAVSHTVVATISVGISPVAIAMTPDQAPLAKFTATVAPAGTSATFDASGSVSPVGTIINYFWDFGDGMTLNTPSPIVGHVYAAPGMYTITLSVTNSAGTSNFQIFNPSSDIAFREFLIGSNASVLNNNGAQNALAIVTFPVPPAIPSIVSVTPSSGSICGGTIVTITGSDFATATAVFFGTTPATSFTVVSDTVITAMAPPGVPGTVDIRVVTSSGITPITSADQFTYLPTAVTGISPNSGSSCQGTVVNISGLGLSCATGVFFGMTPATSFTINSDSSITAVAPPGSGTVDVTVSSSSGTSAITPSDRFTYTSVVLTSISPSSGSACGGTVVHICGLGFNCATNVLFGTTPATSFTINSNRSITAIVPPGVPGTIVDIRIETASGLSAITPADQFTYLALLPPRHLKGRQFKNQFATQKEIVNVITWDTPRSQSSEPVVAYRIYRNKSLTNLVSEVSAHETLSFIDHNREDGRIYRYYVVSVDRCGNVSSPAKVVIKGRRHKACHFSNAAISQLCPCIPSK